MYQTYNPDNQSYGVIYKTSSEACEFAYHFSVIFKCHRWVVNNDTGEIVAMFNRGVTEWWAEG